GRCLGRGPPPHYGVSPAAFRDRLAFLNSSPCRGTPNRPIWRTGTPTGALCVPKDCCSPVKPQEPVTLVGWLPEKLDSDDDSREEQHSLRVHQPECKDAPRDSPRTSP